MSDQDTSPADTAALQRLAQVERQTQAERLTQVESELAVRSLIARYGMAVDCGDADMAAALHTEDCVYEVAAPGAGRDDEDRHQEENLILQGRPAIHAMVSGSAHQALLPNCAHTVGPLEVTVKGDTASAMGYSRLYLFDGDKPRLLRLGFNRWQLRKEDGVWRIARRSSCPIGSGQAQELLRDGIQDWDFSL